MWTVHALDALSAVLRGGDVNLDIDATTFVQMGVLVVLLLVLKPTLFDPMLKLFEEREKRIEGNILKAREIDDESAQAKAEYDEALQKARAKGNSEREKLRAEALRAESELLAKVRSETAAAAEAARAQSAGDLASARKELTAESAALARQLATVVLGREVRS